MFEKVLIANRGEIAVRLIRACRELGISPVAVYSEADRASLHVRLADEAYCLGPPPSVQSYLHIEKVIDAARRSSSEAIHPGYGFLSENSDFAQACDDAGIPMIGPSAFSMRLLGNKTSARQALAERGIPIVPGTRVPLRSAEEAMEAAREIGYPLMLKAAAGGGGKGMRRVESESSLGEAFEAAASEAQNAFGDAAVYIEKYIARPRHIEIQVLADTHGNAVHLGERECSVQRRHQKVIEESPSPLVDEGLRRRMGETALAVARVARYVNAGTVEFLVDAERNFYFLEMNTRLQVEHPVTELVSGLDLVHEQFRVAAGERLSVGQQDIKLRGWAVECRIYAEDPDNQFFPSPGTIQRLAEPSGPGVRVDSGIYPGWEVPIHYDPLLAKLVTSGSDRSQAIARMRRALHEYQIEGIKTNLRFLYEVFGDPEFAAGRLSTGFVEEFFRRRGPTAAPSDEMLEAAALAAALAWQDQARSDFETPSSTSADAWREAARPRPFVPGSWRRS